MDKRSPASIWQTAYGQLELQLPRETFNTWLRGARLMAHEDGTFVVGVSNIYAREWLEQRLQRVIAHTLGQIAGRTVEVRFVVWNRPSEAEKKVHEAGPLLAPLAPTSQPEPRFERLPGGETGLNTRQTFEGYAVGNPNRMAATAARAIVEAPAAQFNPLVVRGAIGLGKTHLLNAMGNAALSKGLRPLYVTGETFTNDLVASLRGNRAGEFRDKYRQVDLLLVDGLHFIAGKTATQEEFCHTFDTLYSRGAQIVLSLPASAEAEALDPRILSRLEGGLTVTLDAPDYLTRLDILEIKAAARGFESRLPYNLLERMAEHSAGSIRELEGALNKAIAMLMLNPQAFTEEAAEQILAELRPAPAIPGLMDVIMAAAEYYGVTLEQMSGRDRSREVSTARQVAMYLAREACDCALAEIGAALGGRNHSTVLYACERVADLAASPDSALSRDLRAIGGMLQLQPIRRR